MPEIAGDAFAAGARWLLLREKDLPADALAALARDLLAAAEPFAARVALSGDAALAADLGLDALHLPRDGDVAAARRRLDPGALIGQSAHDRSEAERAAAAGADYVSFSPIFESPSKPGYGPALELDGLAEIAADLPIPVVALGGVTAARVAALRDAGAAGFAVMGAVMAAEDPGRAVADLLKAWASAGQAGC